MKELDSFAEFLACLEAGDEEAATKVFNRFGKELVLRARHRIEARAAQKIDPEDVVQSVFRTFFARHAKGQFELDGWDGLLGLLVRITLRKCGRHVASLRAACRDIAREQSWSPTDESARSSGWEAVAREPTPLEAVTFLELVEKVMAGLGPREQEILTMKMQGHTVSEISQRTNRTERTVYRLLSNVRSRIEDLDQPLAKGNGLAKRRIGPE